MALARASRPKAVVLFPLAVASLPMAVALIELATLPKP